MDISNKIYFNHIPKTGGQFLINTIKKSSNLKVYFVHDSTEIKLDILEHADILTGHITIDPHDLFNNLKTFVLLRNPVDRLISHYCMFANHREDSFEVKLQKFNDWLFDDSQDIFIKTNFQSKCLTNPRDFIITNPWDIYHNRSNYFKNGFGIKKIETDFNNAFKYLDSCELVLINEKLLKQSNDIANFLNINLQTLHNNLNNVIPYLINPNSNIIRQNITIDQFNKIIKLNEIDLELYNHFYVKS